MKLKVYACSKTCPECILLGFPVRDATDAEKKERALLTARARGKS